MTEEASDDGFQVRGDEATNIEHLPFVKIFFPLLYDVGLSPLARQIYLVLKAHLLRKGKEQTWVLKKNFAAQLGISVRSVERALHDLKADGLVVVGRRRRGRSTHNVYTLIHPAKVYGISVCKGAVNRFIKEDAGYEPFCPALPQGPKKEPSRSRFRRKARRDLAVPPETF